MRKTKLILIAVFPLFFVTFMLIHLFLVNSKVQIHSDKLRTNNVTLHILKPLEYKHPSIEKRIYPYVNTSPTSKKYGLVLASDHINELLGIQDNLFLAAKRVSELREWASEIHVDKKSKALSNFYFLNEYTWENVLKEYSIHMKRHLESIETDPDQDSRRGKLAIYKNFIEEDRETLSDAIIQAHLNPDTKEDLRRLVGKISDALMPNKNLTDSLHSPLETAYELNPLVSNREFGAYELSIDTIHTSSNEYDVSLNSKNIHYEQDKKTIVPISDKSKHILLVAKKSNLFDNAAWEHKTLPNKSSLYSTIIPTQLSSMDSLWIKAQLIATETAQLKVYEVKSSGRKLMYVDELKKNLIQKVETTLKIAPDTSRIEVTVLIPHLKKDLDPMGILSLTAYTINPPPNIILHRLSRAQGDMRDNSQNHSFLFLVFFFTTLVYMSLLLMYFKICKVKTSIASRFEGYREIVTKLFQEKIINPLSPYSRVLFWIWLLSILCDLFLLQSHNNLTTYISIITFLPIYLLIRKNIRTLAFLGTIGVGGLVVSSCIYPSINEKLSLWVFTYTVLMMLSLAIGRHEKNQMPVTNTELELYVATMYSNLLLFYRRMSVGGKGILRAFYGKPKTMRQKLLLVFRVLSMCLLLSLIISRGIILIRLQYHIFTTNITKSHRTPKISSIQPKIVYHSTWVMVKGSEFGWKEHDSAKLMSTFGEVEGYVWTNSEITFPVPLHWNTGTIDFWLEKTTIIDNKKVLLKSNIYSIKLIAINDWDSDDDEFFKQLPYLDKRVLELNGYKN